MLFVLGCGHGPGGNAPAERTPEPLTATTFTYDRLGRKIRTVLPNGTTTTQVFNCADWITKIEHRERALFRKVNDRWAFVDGIEIKGPPVVRTDPRVGRNDPCPCGSGKKYKKCHGVAA